MEATHIIGPFSVEQKLFRKMTSVHFLTEQAQNSSLIHSLSFCRELLILFRTEASFNTFDSVSSLILFLCSSDNDTLFPHKQYLLHCNVFLESKLLREKNGLFLHPHLSSERDRMKSVLLRVYSSYMNERMGERREKVL